MIRKPWVAPFKGGDDEEDADSNEVDDGDDDVDELAVLSKNCRTSSELLLNTVSKFEDFCTVAASVRLLILLTFLLLILLLNSVVFGIPVTSDTTESRSPKAVGVAKMQKIVAGKST